MKPFHHSTGEGDGTDEGQTPLAAVPPATTDATPIPPIDPLLGAPWGEEDERIRAHSERVAKERVALATLGIRMPDPAKRDPLQPDNKYFVAIRRRHDGWTADRQRIFLTNLANTGSVAHAAEAADITARSAYRLRNHPKGAAFARAWDAALMRAGGRLASVAFERAIAGTPRTVWRDGKIVAHPSVPSDRMLMFLLRSLMPQFYGRDGDLAARAKAVAALADAYPEAITALEDTDVRCDILDIDDWKDARRWTTPPERGTATRSPATFVTFRGRRGSAPA